MTKINQDLIQFYVLILFQLYFPYQILNGINFHGSSNLNEILRGEAVFQGRVLFTLSITWTNTFGNIPFDFNISNTLFIYCSSTASSTLWIFATHSSSIFSKMHLRRVSKGNVVKQASRYFSKSHQLRVYIYKALLTSHGNVLALESDCLYSRVTLFSCRRHSCPSKWTTFDEALYSMS